MNATAFVVDDNPINRHIATLMLQQKGWVVESFSLGREVLERLSSFVPEVILLDISMPGQNGFSVCKEVRQNKTRSDLRIIAYTAHAHLHDRPHYLQCGFDDLLIKPINGKSISEVIGSPNSYDLQTLSHTENRSSLPST